MENLRNWDLVVATLFHSGSANRILSPEARVRVWTKGDGYGKMSSAQLRSLGLIEDWSHIRDSGKEAQEAIVAQIRHELLQMDRTAAHRVPDGYHESLVAQVVAKLGVRS